MASTKQVWPERYPDEPVGETTDLGLRMLIVDSEDGNYEPVAVVSTIREARELAAADMRQRLTELDRGGFPLPPVGYRVWTRNFSGTYEVVAGIEI